MSASKVTVLEPADLARFSGRTVLVVTPHADDPALFCGGTLALLARAGANLVYLRITNDDTDSAGLTLNDTIRRNSAELAAAADILGIGRTLDFGYPSDRMSDVPETELRERLIRVVRDVRPYAVITFDPYSAFGEDNQDHIRTAQAMDETFWTSMFDKHHPEHFDDGLAPHAVVERWYFGRRLLDVTHAVDISEAVNAKCDAAAEHLTMMGHMVHQLSLMASTEGLDLPALSPLLDNPAPLVRYAVAASAQHTGETYGVAAAEEFRMVRFAGMEGLIDYIASLAPDPRSPDTEESA